MRSDHKVLVIAVEPMLAALVGAMVERAGMHAAFSAPGEFADAALERVKPVAAILLDAKTDEAESELFFARAARRKIPILVFGPEEIMNGKPAWLRRHALAFGIPRDLDAVQAELVRLTTPGDTAH